MTSRKKMSPLFAAVLERDGWRCHYCKLTVDRIVPTSHPRRATMDHKIPRSAGGTNAKENLVACCALCNQTKGNMPYEAFLWYRMMKVRGESHEDLVGAIEIVFGRPFSSQLGRLETIEGVAKR